MKYFKEEKLEHGHLDGIVLSNNDTSIFSVAKRDGMFEFTEECDCYFTNCYTKEETLELVEELKNYIINN